MLFVRYLVPANVRGHELSYMVELSPFPVGV